MKYYSIREIADKWELSTRRVAILAKEGRIPGAMLVGNSWMIPQDASKPADRRKLRNGASSPTDSQATADKPEREFRFPLYFLQNFQDRNFTEDMTQEELRLYEAQLHHIHGEFETAYMQLLALSKTAEDRYVRIGCYYHLAMTAQLTKHYATFVEANELLQREFQADYPYKREMSLIQTLQESYSHDTMDLPHPFEMDPSYTYHPTAYPLACVFSSYIALAGELAGELKNSLYPLELLCHEMTTRHYLFAEHVLRLYIADIALLQKDLDSWHKHAKRALELAEEINCYNEIGFHYVKAPDLYNQLLTPKARKRVREIAVIVYDGIAGQLSYQYPDLHFPALTARDHRFAYYALQGLTNHQVAELANLSESTIRKRYDAIYQKTNIHSKKELVDLLLSITNHRTHSTSPED